MKHETFSENSEYSLFYRALLQKSPVILRSLRKCHESWDIQRKYIYFSFRVRSCWCVCVPWLELTRSWLEYIPIHSRWNSRWRRVMDILAECLNSHPMSQCLNSHWMSHGWIIESDYRTHVLARLLLDTVSQFSLNVSWIRDMSHEWETFTNEWQCVYIYIRKFCSHSWLGDTHELQTQSHELDRVTTELTYQHAYRWIQCLNSRWICQFSTSQFSLNISILTECLMHYHSRVLHKEITMELSFMSHCDYGLIIHESFHRHSAVISTVISIFISRRMTHESWHSIGIFVASRL